MDSPGGSGLSSAQFRRSHCLYRRYLTAAAAGLAFTGDVLAERAADSAPYSQADFSRLFQPSGALRPTGRRKTPQRVVSGPAARPRGGQGARPELPAFPGLPASRELPRLPELSELPALPKLPVAPTLHELSSLPGLPAAGQESAEPLGVWGLLGSCRRRRKRGAVSMELCVKEESAGGGGAEEEHNSVSEQREERRRQQEGREQQKQEDSQPRGLQRRLNAANSFQQEVHLRPAKPVQKQDCILLENLSEYQRNLQEWFPPAPEKWIRPNSASINSSRERLQRAQRGLRRWVSLPSQIDAAAAGLQPPDYSGGAQALSPMTEPDPAPMHGHTPTPDHTPSPDLGFLRSTVEEWRSVWQIKTLKQSVSTESLKTDLTSLRYQVRIAAIGTCASRAVNRPAEGQRPESGQYGTVLVEAVPQELRSLLSAALDDPIKGVQLAASVCHYAMGSPNARAREILHNTVLQDAADLGADSWVAAQCLALDGDYSRVVIQRLLAQVFIHQDLPADVWDPINTQDPPSPQEHPPGTWDNPRVTRGLPPDAQQAVSLLAYISSRTTLVRSLLAEQLNSADRRTRLLACKAMSRLKGTFNKDVVNKLMYLMWNDWSHEVRHAAAQTLGRLGKGRDIHNELRLRLGGGAFRCRVEALNLIGQLQIMTAKLLEPFLACLKDDFVSVRKQACITATELLLEDQTVVSRLLELMRNDPAWQVRLTAMQAVCVLGGASRDVQQQLLCCLQQDRLVAVQLLQRRHAPAPQDVLLPRLAVEPGPLVHRQLLQLLRLSSCSLQEQQSDGRHIHTAAASLQPPSRPPQTEAAGRTAGQEAAGQEAGRCF